MTPPVSEGGTGQGGGNGPEARLRLDYVSPLPPVRSGISDYSVDLLPHLEALAEVRVIALPGQPVAEAVRERFRPVPVAEAWGGSGGSGGSEPQPGGRLPLYQMGNNTYHEAVQALALERPGVLTLHDLVLHHLVSEATLGQRDFPAYRERLAADHGWIGETTARCREWGAHVGASLFALPAHRRLLRRQRGVLVHSRWAARTVAEEDPAVRVRAVPMGIPLPPPADRVAGRALRRRLGIPEEAPLLGSFGFQTPIKRTDRVVAALADRRLASAHLLVVGQSPSGESVLEAARALGVADRVHEVGFLAFDDFEAAIAACDLCVNLRYPSAGETSASLLRILAVGRPALVSDHAQFAELPDGGVVKIPLSPREDEPAGSAAEAPGEEVEVLVSRVAELLASPDRLEAMGEAARRHVAEHHAPETAAAAVVEACAAWAEAEPPGDLGRGLEGRERSPSTLTWQRPGGAVTVEVPPGEPGERRPVTVRVENRGPARWLAAHRGPGGVAFEVRLLELEEASDGEGHGHGDGHDLRAGEPWIPLPRDLAPGEAWELTLEVRRPPGPARLEVWPRVLGAAPVPVLEAASGLVRPEDPRPPRTPLLPGQPPAAPLAVSEALA